MASRRPVRDLAFAPSLDQIRKILKTAAGTEQAMLATLAFAGLRVGELVHLKIEDVDLTGAWIHIVNRRESRTKTGLSRKVPIHPVLRKILSRYNRTKKGNYFFTAPASLRYPQGGHHYNPRDPNVWIQVIAKACGIRVGRGYLGICAHSCRHFFRTQTMNSGVNAYVADIWMGHVGERSTGKLYFHLSDDGSQEWMIRVEFGAPIVPDDTGEPEQDADTGGEE